MKAPPGLDARMTAAWHRRQEEKRVLGEQAMQIARPLLERAERFEVRNWKVLPVTVAGSAVGALLCAAGYYGSSWGMLLFGAAFCLGAALAWMIVIPQLFKPLLSLTKGGADAAGYGFIPWTAIDGIASVGNRLLLRVPALAALSAQMHPCTRLLYRLRPRQTKTQVILVMRDPGPATLTCKVAEVLWEAGTQSKNLFLPQDPGIEQQMRRVNEERARMDALRKTDDIAVHEQAFERYVAAHEGLEAGMNKIREKSRRRTLRALYFIIYAFVVIFVVLVLYRIAGHLLA